MENKYGELSKDELIVILELKGYKYISDDQKSDDQNDYFDKHGTRLVFRYCKLLSKGICEITGLYIKLDLDEVLLFQAFLVKVEQ